MKRLMIATVLLGSLAFTASAHADARALTSKGGECRIDTYASPSRFGVRVTDCSSRRGVRYVRSSGLQY
ncbi:MAG: hypothetical protein H0W09_00890, partial [Solirubrobacterales bacterium]|nr:hypothetical protein [Solirubrobacterales bacterium]